MDRIKETANVVININKYRNNQIQDYDLIKSVCTYFDEIKNEKISQSDLRFLKYISNTVGIPHFYDLLSNYENDTSIEEFDLNTFSSIFYESTLHTSENNKVHKYQKEILDYFEVGKPNRFFLSASTSFGKTHIVFEIIKKMNYSNVVLIFPTIALLSENLEKIISDNNYKYFHQEFSIHTLSEVSEFAKKNIFIYTPERFLSFIEKNETKIKFDFAFVDEVYKIDNDYIIDDEVKENERDVAYRLAVFYALKKQTDVLLAGPYIDFTVPNDKNYNSSFDNFLTQNEIKLVDYNNYEIVNKYYKNIIDKNDSIFDEELSFNFKSKSKDKMLFEIVKSIYSIEDNAIIYCPLKRQVESYSKKIIKEEILNSHNYSDYSNFIDHISDRFDPNWSLILALKNGIGIHHGLIPKYIQKEIISLFNKKRLSVLISTTTITEGVNTSAKNLIVIDSKKGDKPLKKFDAKNISGRAGRFTRHYSGRVIILQNNFMDIINSEPDGIKHKNYDLKSPKDEIDLFYSNEEYLSADDKQRKINVNKEQSNRNIPDFIFDQYKVISRMDKIIVYDRIRNLTIEDFKNIELLMFTLKVHTNISFEGFQVVLNTIRPIVKNKNLQGLIDRTVLNKSKQKEYSVLCSFVFAYLKGGFKGSVDFKINQGKSVDAAIKETSEFVYNTLKYQVVKYLGVFNIMYKFHLSQETSKTIDEIPGIEKLLIKLEYNALTDNGRIASDFGVPSNIVDYYEAESNSKSIKEKFDKYELEIFEKIDKIINKTDQ